MSLNCDYVSQQGRCQSPKDEGNETVCVCMNYKKCYLYPQQELTVKVPLEKENNLEVEVKK